MKKKIDQKNLILTFLLHKSVGFVLLNYTFKKYMETSQFVNFSSLYASSENELVH